MWRFLKNHTWILTCFLAVVLIPQSLTLQSKLEGRLIITGLAIDKVDGLYQITCQIVSPSAGYMSGKDTAGIDFVTVAAKTVREGITKVAATTTKSPGLGHMNFVVIGESLFDEDLTSIIDFIVRDSHTDTSVLMLVASNATEQIKNTKDLELGTAIQLRKAFLSKQNMCNGVMTIANKFLSDKFNPSASSVVSYLVINEEPQQKENSPQANEQSQSTIQNNQYSTEQPKKQGRLSFNPPLALFRDGRHKKTLSSEDEIVGYSILCCTSKNLIMGFEDILQDDGTKTNLTLLSKEKATKVSVEIKEGIPQIKVNTKLSKNQILEIISEESSTENYKTQENYLSGSMQNQIAESLKQKALATYSAAVECGVDILEAATKLQQKHKKQYNEYFSSHTLDDFIEDAQIEIDVKVSSAIK